MPIKYNSDIFKTISNKIHGTKYDYSETNYINNHTKVKIKCPVHGIFEQQPQVHMKGGGCNKCVRDKLSKNFSMGRDNFIKLSNYIHNGKYDYSQVDYINNRIKVKIVCDKHGVFEQSPRSHVNNKSGCPYCVGKYKSFTSDFISKAMKIHNSFYSYDRSDYINAKEKIIITCPKHGDFKITPNNHLRGKGCPICRLSNGEREIMRILIDKKITFIHQKKFNDCKLKKPLPFDFYLPFYNICIEFDGEQHFNKFRFEKNNDGLDQRKLRDIIKTEYCKKNRIRLIRIKYSDDIESSLLDVF